MRNHNDESRILNDVSLVQSQIIISPSNNYKPISKKTFSYLNSLKQCDRILSNLPGEFDFKKQRTNNSNIKNFSRKYQSFYQQLIPSSQCSFISDAPQEIKQLFEILSPQESEFINDFNRKGSNNVYNVFQQIENIRQKLQKCQNCSNNTDIVLKTQLCVDESCNKSFVCGNCMKDKEINHQNHKKYQLFSLGYRFQKRQATLQKKRIQFILSILKQISLNLIEIKEQQKNLLTLQQTFSSIYKLCLQNSKFEEQIKSKFSNIILSLNKYSPQQFRQQILKSVKGIQVLNFDSLIGSSLPKLSFFQSTNQLISKYEQPYFPHLPCNSKMLQPISILLPTIQQLTLYSSTPVCLKQINNLTIINDGEVKMKIDKVKNVKIKFKGRIMDREIKNSIQLLRRWSFNKNKFRKFSFEIDYKANCHPTTQNSPLISQLMKIGSQQINVTLINSKPNVVLKNQINNIFTSFRSMKVFNISISLNHIYSSQSVLVENQISFLTLIESLGNDIQKFHLKLPINLDKNIVQNACKLLSVKKKLTQLNIDFKSPMPSIYYQLKKSVLKRKVVIDILWKKLKYNKITL